MKTTLLFSTGLACGLLALRSLAATSVVADWNAELDTVQQTSLQNASGRIRANALMRAVFAEATNGIEADQQSGRAAEPVPAGANVEAAASQASYSVLTVLYPQSTSALNAQLAKSLAAVDDSASAIAAGKDWGQHVAEVVLAEEGDAVSLNAGSFAKEVQAPASPSLASSVQAAPSAEQAAIGPGRYRFSVLAGTRGTTGYVDASGADARFDRPGGIAADASGNTYVSEQTQCTVRKISPGGVVTTFAGKAGQMGSLDGMGAAARFNQPTGLAVDAAGNVYVADTGNNTIRKIDPSGTVTTLAGIAGASGEADGIREGARLTHPIYVAVDAAENVFVTEDRPSDRVENGLNSPIRKITPDGTVSTLKITPNAEHNHHGAQQICVDRAGNVYVNAWTNGGLWDDMVVLELAQAAEAGNYTASELTPPGGYYAWVSGISLDETGSLLVTTPGDFFHIYTPGGDWQARYPAGVSDTSSMKQIAVGKTGELYVISNGGSDGSGAIEIGIFDPEAKGPVLLSQPYDRWNYVDDSASFWVNAAGGPALTYQWYLNSTPIKGATGSVFFIGDVQNGDAGLYSVVITDNDGSLTSRKARFSVYAKSSPGPGTGTLSMPSGSDTNTTTSSSSAGSATTTGSSSSTGSGAGTTTSSSGSGSAASGGGGFDREIGLAVLVLLIAAASRRHRKFLAVFAQVGSGAVNPFR
jgi:hypothetical protein